MPASLQVHRWPAEAQQLLAEPQLLIAAVDTEKTAKRETVRQLVRRVLQEILSQRLGCAREEIQWLASPGQPLQLAAPHQQIGLSFSHEAGCSLIAINLAGPVGIDLLLQSENPAWQDEIPQLAADYLGPQVAAQLNRSTAASQTRQFAIAWAAHEARLKCLGLALSEWTPALGEQLAHCRTQALALSPNYLAAVALLVETTTG